MNLAPYVDVEFGNEEAFSQFAFVHLLTHNNLAEYLGDQNLAIDNYPLDNMENQKDWMYTHQLVHVALASRLGLSAPQDLETFDLDNEQQFYDWSAIHSGEHDRLFLAVGF